MLIFPIYEKTMQFDEHVIGMANMMIPPGAEKKEEGRTVGKKGSRRPQREEELPRRGDSSHDARCPGKRGY